MTEDRVERIKNIFCDFLESHSVSSEDFEANISECENDYTGIKNLIRRACPIESIVLYAFVWNRAMHGLGTSWVLLNLEWKNSYMATECRRIASEKEECVIFQENGRNYGQTNIICK